MLEIGSSIDIAATAGTVWDILMDVRRYREWNPFIVEAWGSLGVGERVHVRVQSSLGLRLPFRATVLARCDARDLRWRGHFLASWLASGDHTFTLEPAGAARVHFEQREVFSGLLPGLAARLLAAETQRGFDAMNRALKLRAEGAESANARASRALREVGP